MTKEGILKVVSQTRRRAGWLAQRLGGAFEEHFVIRARMQGFEVTEIPDSCRQMRNKIIRVPSPFDLILHRDSQSAFIDLKRSEESRLVYSKIIDHQLRSLILASTGGPAGYVADLNGEIVFFSVAVLSSCKPRTSLSSSDGVVLGTRDSFNLKLIFKKKEQ